jgi:hypothetical protein
VKRLSTAEELIDFLQGDLSWRRAELTRFDIMLQERKNRSMIPALARAAIVLVYAHWEGFVKQAATAYVNHVSCQGIKVRDLTPPFLALALRGKILLAAQSTKPAVHTELTSFLLANWDSASVINWEEAITTKSNLSSKVFRDIVLTLGLQYRPSYELKQNFIDANLLVRRHAVAHGEARPMKRADFDELRAGVLELMQDFRAQVEDAAIGGHYRN